MADLSYLLRVGGWSKGLVWKFENGKCLGQLLEGMQYKVKRR